LLLARALLRPPPFLILDEPTSALDTATARRILQNLCSLDTSLVLITHQLETLRRADAIYVMHQGTVLQQGRYADLASAVGPFRDLLARPIGPVRGTP
jgi:ATP-binding cassette subfamily C protein CydD